MLEKTYGKYEFLVWRDKGVMDSDVDEKGEVYK